MKQQLLEAPPSVVAPTLAAEKQQRAIAHVEWMLGLIHRQFERLTQENPRPSILANVLPEHEEPLRALEETLTLFKDRLCSGNFVSATYLYDEAVGLATVPPYHPTENPIQNPLHYYWQMLSWNPEYASFRSEDVS